MMNMRSRVLTFATALLVAHGVVAAEQPAAKKLNVVYWTAGTHHDFGAMAKILPPALSKLLKTEVKVCTDAKFLDAPNAEQLDVIVMNHCYQKAEGVLTEQGKRRLMGLISGGVGVVAIHASYYSFPEWKAYHDRCYGTRFTTHGSAKAVVVVETVDKDHPIMQPLAGSFEIVSELYESKPLPKDCHVLAMAHEKGNDAKHPSVWTRMVGKGRIVTILPGHWPDNYKLPDFQKLIARSALWAARRIGAK
jgi:uncharacterized protein